LQVHPLPETLKKFVWNFGKLSKDDISQYAYTMAREILHELSNQKIVLFAELVAAVFIHSSWIFLPQTRDNEVFFLFRPRKKRGRKMKSAQPVFVT